MIPEEIYAVEGKECSVYFANLAMNGGVPGEIEVFSKVGRQDAKRWRFVPEAKHAGKSFPLKIEWKAPDGKTLATCESVVKVVPACSGERCKKRNLRAIAGGQAVFEKILPAGVDHAAVCGFSGNGAGVPVVTDFLTENLLFVQCFAPEK